MKTCFTINQENNQKKPNTCYSHIKKNSKLRKWQVRNAAYFPLPKVSRGVSAWKTDTLLMRADDGVNCDSEWKVRENLNTSVLQPKNLQAAALFRRVGRACGRTVVWAALWLTGLCSEGCRSAFWADRRISRAGWNLSHGFPSLLGSGGARIGTRSNRWMVAISWLPRELVRTPLCLSCSWRTKAPLSRPFQELQQTCSKSMDPWVEKKEQRIVCLWETRATGEGGVKQKGRAV